jgi:hypothetical protein
MYINVQYRQVARTYDRILAYYAQPYLALPEYLYCTIN